MTIGFCVHYQSHNTISTYRADHMPDTQSTTPITTILAVWGALVSTGLAVIKLNEFYRDRSHVNVKVKCGVRIVPESHPYSKSNILSVTVVNVDRRPVTITGCALLMPRSVHVKYLFCNDELSAQEVELTEGKPHHYYFDEDTIRTRYGLRPSKYIAWVRDATGKSYWSHNFFIRLPRLWPSFSKR